MASNERLPASAVREVRIASRPRISRGMPGGANGKRSTPSTAKRSANTTPSPATMRRTSSATSRGLLPMIPPVQSEHLPRFDDTERAPRLSTPDRPLRADARRNRERVLTAAREAFAESGYGVPLDAIAARGGVGPGTVYRHFPTKEALFEAVTVARVRELVALARSGADAP